MAQGSDLQRRHLRRRRYGAHRRRRHYPAGENSYTGNTLIGTDSELALGNGGTTGSLSTTTNITDNGLLTVNRSDDVALNGVISGSRAFRQLGSGVTRTGGNNSYAGTTTVGQGTLLINGVQTGTGLTTVQSGTTLGGYGTWAGTWSLKRAPCCVRG